MSLIEAKPCEALHDSDRFSELIFDEAKNLIEGAIMSPEGILAAAAPTSSSSLFCHFLPIYYSYKLDWTKYVYIRIEKNPENAYTRIAKSQ